MVDLTKYKSVAFVGMDKNAGKTETMNFFLSYLHKFNVSVAVTSIGIDGETVDQVTQTSKPQVFIHPNTLFVTSEKLYDKRQIVSSVCELSKYSTSLGRLLTARAETYGNVMLSGPTNTLWLKQLINYLEDKCDICLVDGALSRKSFASPMITQAMILSTGAVVSASIQKIVAKTKFLYDMTLIPRVEDDSLREKLSQIDAGIYAILDDKGTCEDLQIPSLLMIDKFKDRIFAKSKTLYIPGMITDKLLELIRQKGKAEQYTLITKDFTHIFSSDLNTNWFLKNGGKILCLYQTEVLAISVNPVSPLGFKVDNKALLGALREKIDIPIYNIRDINQ